MYSLRRVVDIGRIMQLHPNLVTSLDSNAKNNNGFLAKDIIERIKAFEETLKVILITEPISDHSFDSLLNDAFLLRIMGIEYIREQNMELQDTLNELITDEIIKAYCRPINKDLNYALSSCLDFYHRIQVAIVTNHSKKIAEHLERFFEWMESEYENLSQENPGFSYEDYTKAIQEHMDNPNFYILWTDASLKMEIALLASEMVNTGEIRLEVKQIKKLSQFLKNQTQLFAAYAIVLGLWTPDSDDNSNETMGAQILASTIELDNGSDVTFDLNEFLSDSPKLPSNV